MEKLMLKTSTGKLLLDTSAIIRVEASSNYSKLFLSNGKTLVTAKLLRWFEEKLQPASFTRLHRSHLINNHYLHLYQHINNTVELQDGKIVPVSRRRKKGVLSRILAACLVFVFISLSGNAQNVGIGTTVPAGRLHIDLNGTANTFAILIDDDDNPVIRFRRLGTSKGFLEARGDNFILGTYATNPLGKLMLQTNSSNRMTFTPAGNIGIGTEDATSKFQIASGADVSLTSNGYLMLGTDGGLNIVMDNNEIQARSDSAVSDLFFQHEGGKVQIGKTSETNTLFDGVNIQALYNGSAGELVLQGLSGGKTRLGSGLDFATTKLHISTGVDAGVASNQSGYMMIGMSNAENVVFDNNEILARNNGVVSTLFLARDGSKVQLGNGAEATGTKLHITSGNDAGLANNLSGYIMMGSQTGSNMVLDNNEIQVRNNGASGHMYLQNGGGNVFIGDATNFTSSHRLGVDGNAVVTGALRIGSTVTPSGYKLAVDGKAICTELLVRLVPNWPDYVFNKNYKLPDLNELEDFIKKNKHLPGIPTAKTLEETGINVGEMHKLQMEKIEELTLYIIELNKEIEKLKKQNK